MLTAELVDMNDNIIVKHFTGIENIDCNTNYNNNLNIIYLNIQSLRNKLYNLELLISSFECEIHVIVLSEIWLSQHENKFFNLPQYTAYFSNRADSYGGVAIFVKNKISSTFVFEEEYAKSNILVIKLIKQGINIVAVYRSHETNMYDFINKIDEYSSKYKQAIFLGDINLNILNYNSRDVRTYCDTLLSNGFVICNKISEQYATRISKTSQTIIDHFITDIIKNQYFFHILDTSLSDHQLFFISMNHQPLLENVINFKTVLSYDKITNDEFWSKINTYNNFNQIVHELTNLIKTNTNKVQIKDRKKKT